jgi:hypothetical protein
MSTGKSKEEEGVEGIVVEEKACRDIFLVERGL